MGQRSTHWAMRRTKGKGLRPTATPGESGGAEGSNEILVKLSSNQKVVTVGWAIAPSF